MDEVFVAAPALVQVHFDSFSYQMRFQNISRYGRLAAFLALPNVERVKVTFDPHLPIDRSVVHERQRDEVGILDLMQALDETTKKLHAHKLCVAWVDRIGEFGLQDWCVDL